MRTSSLRNAAIGIVCLCALIFGALLLRVTADVRAAGGNTIQGTVTAEDTTAPLADMTVTLWQPSGGSWVFEGTYKTTDENGVYSFPNLADGEYTLLFESGNSYVKEAWNDKASIESADPIHLSGGATFTADAALARAGSISGIVTDRRTGAPLDAVDVHYFRKLSPAGEPAAWQAIHNVPTKDGGLFVIENLPHGVYTLAFYGATTNQYAIQYYNDKPTLASADEITVGADPVEGISASLVAYASISGMVRDAKGLPVAGIYACALPADAPQPTGVLTDDGCLVPGIMSAADGNYAISGITAGDYVIHFFDGDFPQRYLDFWYVNAVDASARTIITLAESEQRAHVDVQITETFSVFGTVQNPAATPVADIQVRLYALHAGKWNWHHTTSTNTSGQYEFQIPEPVTVSVALIDSAGVYMPKYTANATTLEGADSTHIPTDTLRYNATAPLATGTALSGAVLDAEGAPLAGIEVHAWLAANTARNAEWLRATTTNENGIFWFHGAGEEPLLFAVRDPAGIHQSAWYAGATTASAASNAQPVLVIPGAANELMPIRLAPATTSAPSTSSSTWGTVTDSDEQPIVGAQVHLYWMPGWRARVHAMDAEALTCPPAASAIPQPLASGMLVNASAETVAPPSNPIVTDALGRFGWELAPGCWYVHVSAAGYYDNTSPLYGITSAMVENPPLVVQLASLPTPTPNATATYAAATTATAQASATNQALATATKLAALATQHAAMTRQALTATARASTPATPTPTVTPNQTPTPMGATTPAGTSTPISTPTPTPPPTPIPTPTHTPTPPIAPPVPAREVVDFSGIVFEDLNSNGTKEAHEVGIANAILTLAEITPEANVYSAPQGAEQGAEQGAVSSITGAYLFVDVPVGRYLLHVEMPTGFKPFADMTIALQGGSSPGLHLPLGVERATTYVMLPIILK